MKKKTKSKLHLSDVFLVLICLSAALFFLHLFYKDLYSYTTRSDKKPIGKISYTYRTTQRKFDDRVVWERVAQNAALYNADTIRTTQEAHTIIQFKDGTVLDLLENTMLQVFFSEREGLQITINDGGIELNSSQSERESKVVFEDGSSVKVDSGTSLSAAADVKNREKNVEIKSGNAQITTEAGDEMELVEGTSVTVSTAGRILKNPLSVTYPPKELKILNTDNNEFTNIEFAWKNETDAPVIVQTSKVKNFSTLLTDEIINYSSSYTLEAPNGTTYWRVLTMYTINTPIEGKIIIDNSTNMHSLSPLDTAIYRYTAELPRIKFRWSGNENASHYRLVISSTRDMQNVVATREVQDAFLTLDSIGEGTWFWQVTPYYSFNNIGYTGASEISSFVIEKTEQYNPPELLLPSSHATLFRKEDTPLIASFAWKTELENASHTLLIARDELMESIVLSEEVSGGRFQKELDTQTFSEGTYYWKIKRVSAEEDTESSVRLFNIAQYVPEENKLLYPPDNFSAEASILSSLQFLWKKADEYKKEQSVFQVARDEAFNSLQIEKVLDTSFIGSLALTEGKYYWRVGVKNSDEDAKAFTPVRSFTVLKKLDTPKITSPLYNQEVVVSGSKTVPIAWQRVSGADSYNVKIFDEEENLITEQLSVKSLSCDFALVTGSYVVRVQAQSSGSDIAIARQGTASSLSFRVRSPEAIALETPLNNAEIEGLTALRQPTYFSWQIGKDKAASYTFILEKEQKNGTFSEVNSSSNSGHSVMLRRLEEGRYKWSVSARTADNMPLDSEEHFFVITEIPPLSLPNLLEPENNLTMREAYLKDHRTIVFRWQGVKGATAYDFALYKVESNGKRSVVMSKKGMRETQVRLTDLTVLDIGAFEWSVQAHSYARDGFEEQASPVAKAMFSIRFEKPTIIESKETGSMYAQ